jgi:hypothetical protein
VQKSVKKLGKSSVLLGIVVISVWMMLRGVVSNTEVKLKRQYFTL